MSAVPAPPDVLYPMPGATGVPDGTFTLVVGDSITPPAMQLVTAGGDLPSPAATPRSSSEGLYGLAVPALAAHTTYNAQVTFGTPPCRTMETAGSFTTQ